VTTAVNTDKIRREDREGREVIVVPSATLPDDVIMNNVKYPAEEIKNSFATLNRTPAPLGHPEKGGMFLSASAPEAINEYWVGAWNENVRQEKMPNGSYRVHVDKAIDVEVANRTEGGRAVLEAIEKGEPIHTSTGLFANLKESEEDGYGWTAHDIQFDHDAILLNEKGAATPEQGVGMMVNGDGEKVEIEVINSMLDAAEQELDWGLDMAFRALEKEARVPMIEQMKTALREVFFGSQRKTTAVNSKEPDSMDKEQFDNLSATVETLAETVKEMQNSALTPDAVAEAIATAIKPVTDQVTAANAAQEAKDEAELKDLREKIVKANLLDEAEAEELTLNTARSLAKKCEPGKAAPISGAFQNADGEDEFADYDPNEHLKEAS
jgi:hypothetical protein